MNTAKKGLGRPKKEADDTIYTATSQKPSFKKLHTGTRQTAGTKTYGGQGTQYYQDDESNSASDSDNFEPYDEASHKKRGNSTKDKSKGRHDNSLSVLTKKFIELIRSSPNLTVNLNEVVKELNVQKRRIYDITNVLEGIGYVEKVLKNKIKWVGGTEGPAMDKELKGLIDELDRLRMEENEVDRWTNQLQESLTALSKDDTHNKLSYVNFEDIKAVNAHKDNDQPFFVIRAPKGTTLEVPLPNQEGKDQFPHKLSLASQNEPIFIYVVSDNKDGGEVGQLKF